MQARTFTLLAASAAAMLCFLSPNLAEAEKIDGFGVKILPLPTFDKRSRPDSVTGEVKRFVGNEDGAVDPFYMIPGLQGVSPYLAIFAGASATFTFPATHILRFYWGTPDDINFIYFYKSGKLIGTLQGADFQKAFGFSEANRPFPIGQEDMVRIRSKASFDTVVFSDTTHCCFEISILRERPWTN